MTDDPVQSGACWLLMANHYISGVLTEGRAKGASIQARKSGVPSALQVRNARCRLEIAPS